MRKRITTNVSFGKYVVIVYGVATVIISILILSKNPKEKTLILIISCLLLALCFLFYYLLNRSKSVEFDDEYMFITNINGEEKIPLKNISKIKKTLAQINDRDIWKVYYVDQYNNKRNKKIWPRRRFEYFSEFKKVVIKNNPDAIVN